MHSFRENLRSELDFQGLTVKELAARTGIIKGTLDNYLGARASIPPADIAVKIADALHVSVEYLVTGADKQREDAETVGPANAEEKSLLHDLTVIPQHLRKTLRTLIHQTAQSVRSGAE
ncbi:MAG: helix-turn-helix transcriptional regulator [Treponema sp.]|nr:helix-turn-helix transcriptional regulator [Treponema sp.]